jgi:hypothetical protein
MSFKKQARFSVFTKKNRSALAWSFTVGGCGLRGGGPESIGQPIRAPNAPTASFCSSSRKTNTAGGRPARHDPAVGPYAGGRLWRSRRNSDSFRRIAKLGRAGNSGQGATAFLAFTAIVAM